MGQHSGWSQKCVWGTRGAREEGQQRIGNREGGISTQPRVSPGSRHPRHMAKFDVAPRPFGPFNQRHWRCDGCQAFRPSQRRATYLGGDIRPGPSSRYRSRSTTWLGVIGEVYDFLVNTDSVVYPLLRNPTQMVRFQLKYECRFQ